VHGARPSRRRLLQLRPAYTYIYIHLYGHFEQNEKNRFFNFSAPSPPITAIPVRPSVRRVRRSYSAVAAVSFAHNTISNCPEMRDARIIIVPIAVTRTHIFILLSVCVCVCVCTQALDLDVYDVTSL